MEIRNVSKNLNGQVLGIFSSDSMARKSASALNFNAVLFFKKIWFKKIKRLIYYLSVVAFWVEAHLCSMDLECIHKPGFA